MRSSYPLILLFVLFGCSQQHQAQPTLSNKQLWDWFYSQENAAAFGREFDGTSTTSYDDFSIDFSKASRFHTDSGIAIGTTFAFYDAERRTVVLHWTEDASNTTVIISEITRPNFKIAGIDSSRIATLQGLRIGSSLREVQRALGKAFVEKYAGSKDLTAYEQWKPVAKGGFEIGTAFLIRHDHVVAIWRSSKYFVRKPAPSLAD